MSEAKGVICNDDNASIEAVLHDFDGVLVDSTDFNLEFFGKLLKELEISEPLSRAEIMACFHMTLTQSIDTLAGPKDSTELRQMRERALELDRPIELLKFPRNQERTLERLAGYKLNIVTSAIRQCVLDAYERRPYLENYFDPDDIVAIEDVTYGDIENAKPNPEPVLLALERIGVRDANRAVLVGDGDTDMVAAKRAKLRAGIHLLLTSHSTMHEDASARVRRYAQVPAAVRRLGQAALYQL